MRAKLKPFWTLRGVALLALLGMAQASPAAACEYCFWTWINPTRSYCKIVVEGQVGVTSCENVVSRLGDSFCEESGNACGVVNVPIGGGGGGGSAGSGGGGSNPCQTAGFCPAQCFNCSGGGGGGVPAN